MYFFAKRNSRAKLWAQGLAFEGVQLFHRLKDAVNYTIKIASFLSPQWSIIAADGRVSDDH